MKIIYILFFSLILTACQSGSDAEQKYEVRDIESDSTAIKDSLAMQDSLLSDTIEEKKIVPVDVTDADGYEDKDAAEKIIKANKEQLSFCECAKKMNQLEQEMEAAEGDALEKLFDDMEKMQKGECAILFVSPNRTPDERKAHQRRIQKCLEN